MEVHVLMLMLVGWSPCSSTGQFAIVIRDCQDYMVIWIREVLETIFLDSPIVNGKQKGFHSAEEYG